MGIEGIEDLAGHQDDATELPDGEAERQSQDEEKLRDHEERQRRLNEESSPPNPGGTNHEE